MMVAKRFLAFLISSLLVWGGGCTPLRPLAPHNLVVIMTSPLATPTPSTGLDVIALPVDFLPSGITSGQGSEFFVGSRGGSNGGGSHEGGQIYRGDFLTGEVELFLELEAGQMAAGLQFDPRTNYLFVSGADDVRIYDTTSGALVERYVVGQEQGLVSDLVVTAAGVYAADLFRPVFYHIPLAPDGTLLAGASGETLALSGEYPVTAGFNPFQTTGIAATADGSWLLTVNSTLGMLYRVDPSTGAAQQINGVNPMLGDGLVLDGELLYVVQSPDLVSIMQLAPDLTTGELIGSLATNDYAFNLPTAAVLVGDALYVVNGLPGSSRTAAPGTPGQDHAVILRVPRWRP